MSTPSLTGPRVLLRAPRPDDERDRQRQGWRESIERNYGRACRDRPMTDQEARAWFVEQIQAAADPTRRHWMIEADGVAVGTAFLHHVNDVDRKARFAVGMFSPSHIGRGLGAEATRLVLGFAFADMGLHRVDLRVLAFNEAAQRCYERCGFVPEGRERESCWLDGRWHDDIIMGLLVDDFRCQSGQTAVSYRDSRRHSADTQPPGRSHTGITRLIRREDAAGIAELLRRNREFLTPWDPIRSEEFYTEAGQSAVIEQLLEGHARGVTLPHVILHSSGGIAGRITGSIERGPRQSCGIGYWVSQDRNGQGLATAAVARFRALAFQDLALHRLQAETLVHNRASQRVLTRNGFQQIGLAPAYLSIAGRWQDHILFQALNPHHADD